MSIDVSIIIPVFNSEKTLQRAVLSTLDQGVSNEIILVNDCSSDHSLQVAEKLKNSLQHINIINLEENSGASAARNKAIDIARGKYIAFLDADDVWLPGKLKAQKEIIESDEKCTIVSCDSLQISPIGRVLRRAHAVKPAVSGNNAWKTLLAYSYIPTPTVLTRTDLVREIGGFDESLIVSEDLDLWISLARKGTVEIIPEVFVHYFDYSQSLMKSGIGNSFEKTMTMIQHHVIEEQRLTEKERNTIMSTRYLHVGLDALSSQRVHEADFYLKKAVQFGHPKIHIYKKLLKRKIKSKLKSLRSELRQ
jgi:glycosyltransferase involved in cell wall biosynthesis